MVDDEKKPEKIEALKRYLQDQFADLEVRYHHNFDHMAEVFTVIKGPSTNFMRLIVSEDYIDDHIEAESVEAMNNLDIGRKLEGCGEENLFLGNDGLVVMDRG